MYASWFSYPITRPYPLRWFTPVALLGGALLTVLFSLANLAPNGFYLRTIYTTDPNTTTTAAQSSWFWKAPFNWDSSINPQCQSQTVSVGDKIFSTNLGFYYEVTGISQFRNGEDSNNNYRPVSLPSVLYYNNTLEDCRMVKVDFRLLKEGTGSNWWILWRNSLAEATVQCSIVSESGFSNLTLRAEYKRFGAVNNPYDNVVLYNHVIDDNSTTHASVWWGTRLIEAAWYGVTTAMVQWDQDEHIAGGIQFYWNETRSPQRSIVDPDLFDMSWYFIRPDGGFQSDFRVVEDPNQLFDEMINNPEDPRSPVLTEALLFGKLFHSLIAIDLGNAQLPNFLKDEEGLRAVTSGEGDMNRQPKGLLYEGIETLNGGDDYGKIPPPEPLARREQYVYINQSYAQFRPLTGALGTKNATIFTQYLCSVPAQKNTDTLLLAILIADLVFLQAAWKLYSWVAESIVSRRDPNALACKRCLDLGVYSVVEVKDADSRSAMLGVEDENSGAGVYLNR